MSHPVWVRGLKHILSGHTRAKRRSHPVWVRGLKLLWIILPLLLLWVAPCVGAWIETKIIVMIYGIYVVAPRVGAWIETSFRTKREEIGMSHPVWVRGLKLPYDNSCTQTFLSHPVWVRGLKQLGTIPICLRNHVAPRVGAWIETGHVDTMCKSQDRRTPCGCVD